MQLWKIYDDGTLENKEKGNFSSETWKFNNQTDSLFYIEDDSTKEVLQATSGNEVKLATKVTLPGKQKQLWKKGNPNIENYFTIENTGFSRFLTVNDTETVYQFKIEGKIMYTVVLYSNQIGVVAFNVHTKVDKGFIFTKNVAKWFFDICKAEMAEPQ